jgi:hypothetical protein
MIALADHVETRDGLADLAQQCFFEIQSSIIAWERGQVTKPRVYRLGAA